MKTTLLILLCVVAGCSQKPDARDAKIVALEERVDQLKTELGDMTMKADVLSNKLVQVERDRAAEKQMVRAVMIDSQKTIDTYQELTARLTNPPPQKVALARKPASVSTQDLMKANQRTVLRNELINQQLAGRFQVFQKISDGLLTTLPYGDIALVVGAANANGRVDGEVIQATLYRCGSYVYSTTGGSQKTVMKYTVNLNDALDYYADKVAMNGPVVLP